jgi:hypothetical protein
MTAPHPEARMDRDDLQVSLVLSGGVGLAIWISGAMPALTERRVVIDTWLEVGGIGGLLRSTAEAARLAAARRRRPAARARARPAADRRGRGGGVAGHADERLADPRTGSTSASASRRGRNGGC